MIIGIPKEIKQDEFRISLPPDKVHLLKENGHKVLVEAGAGIGAGIKDEVYSKAGATIVADRLEIFASAKMIIKVKEPQEEELQELPKLVSEPVVSDPIQPQPSPVSPSEARETLISSEGSEFFQSISSQFLT